MQTEIIDSSIDPSEILEEFIYPAKLFKPKNVETINSIEKVKLKRSDSEKMKFSFCVLALLAVSCQVRTDGLQIILC